MDRINTDAFNVRFLRERGWTRVSSQYVDVDLWYHQDMDMEPLSTEAAVEFEEMNPSG